MTRALPSSLRKVICGPQPVPGNGKHVYYPNTTGLFSVKQATFVLFNKLKVIIYEPKQGRDALFPQLSIRN